MIRNNQNGILFSFISIFNLISQQNANYFYLYSTKIKNNFKLIFMETLINNTETENTQNLLVTAEIQTYLRTASSWATFLAILGFIGSFLMILIGLAITLIGGTLSSLSNTPDSAIGSAILPYMGIFYIIIAAVYLLPALYLFQFAEKTKKAIDNYNQELLSAGLEKLKSTFKTLGIMTITFIVITIVGYGTLIAFMLQSKILS